LVLRCPPVAQRDKSGALPATARTARAVGLTPHAESPEIGPYAPRAVQAGPEFALPNELNQAVQLAGERRDAGRFPGPIWVVFGSDYRWRLIRHVFINLSIIMKCYYSRQAAPLRRAEN
jgi:hypothetical protein